RGKGLGMRDQGLGGRGQESGVRGQGSGISGERSAGLRRGAGVDVAAVEAYAQDFRQRHLGKWVQVERLGGFCLLVKRAVLKAIEAQERLADISDLGLFDT